MNLKNDSANRLIPTVGNEKDANLAFILPEPTRVIRFPEPVDHFLGCCAGCGFSVYSSEDHRLYPSLTCAECIAEEKSWKVVAPAVYEVAA